MKDISKEQKIYELSLIWREAEYNFGFWDKRKDLNWDEEYKKALTRVLNTDNLYDYYQELIRFAFLLQDGHTDVWMPKEIYQDPLYSSSLPVFFRLVGNDIVVENVKTSAKDLVKQYSIVRKINNVPVWDYINENIYPYIWHQKLSSSFHLIHSKLIYGALNSVVDFEFEESGNVYTATLTRTFNENTWSFPVSSKISEKLDKVYDSASHRIYKTKDDIALIVINTMMNDDLKNDIFANYELLKSCKGYIIDVRHNGGGNSNNSDAVASLFIGKSFKHMRKRMPVHMSSYKAWGQSIDEEEVIKSNGTNPFVEKCYKIYKKEYYEEEESTTHFDDCPGLLEGPIVILTNEFTASSAENLIDVMRYNTNAKIVGKATYGSTGQPLFRNLDSGGGFRICTIQSVGLDGTEFINKGFIPDVSCEPSIEDLKNGIDRVLEEGLKVIRQNK